MKWFLIILFLSSNFFTIKSSALADCRWNEWSTNLDHDKLTAGDPIQFTYLKKIPRDQLDQRIPKGLPKSESEVHLFRLVYRSETLSGKIENLSALMIVPDLCLQSFPTIMLHHGTIISNQDAPTVNPREGLLEASQGFVTLVPDFYGYGSTKKSLHPYLIADGYVNSSVSLLRATRKLSKLFNVNLLDKLFLKGYSAGGYSILALQKALETNYSEEFKIQASAPTAGPYNLLVTGYNLLDEAITNPVFLSFIIVSYFEYLTPELELETILRQPYQWKVRNLFRGSFTYDEVFQRLPSGVEELIVPEYRQYFLSMVDRFLKGQDVEFDRFQTELLENSLDRNWHPQTRTTFYHCVDDEIVPIQSSDHAYKELGSNNSLVNYVRIESPSAEEPYTHTNCPGYYLPVTWFKSLVTQ